MTDLDTQAADVLEAAVDLLVTRGWCAWVLETETGRHCAIGAMIRGGFGVMPQSVSVANRPPALERALGAVVETVLEQMPSAFITNWERVAEWNNESLQPERVIDGLRLAAKELRNVAVPA